MVPNAQANFNETLVFKLLLSIHLEQEVNIIWYLIKANY